MTSRPNHDSLPSGYSNYFEIALRHDREPTPFGVFNPEEERTTVDVSLERIRALLHGADACVPPSRESGLKPCQKHLASGK